MADVTQYLIRAKSMLKENALLDVMLLLDEDEENVVIEIKGTKTSIGNSFDEANVVFKNHEVDLIKGDQIVVFSDGFADQFGGPKQKKYTYKRFREFLLSINTASMDEQRELLMREFESWQKDGSQTDDVLVMSVKI